MKSFNNLGIFKTIHVPILFFALISLLSCNKTKKDPEVITVSLVKASYLNLRATAILRERGDYTITDFGFMSGIALSGNFNSTSSLDKISVGGSLPRDTFTALISTSNSQSYPSSYKIWVWSYVTNSKGTIYGKPVAHDMLNLQLTRIVPLVAKQLDTVTIYGSNFGSDLASNFVQFNSMAAKVVAVSSDFIKVLVPAGINLNYSSYITITVTAGGQTASLNSSFQLLGSPTGFSPNTGTWGTTIYVTGNNLNSSSLIFGNLSPSYYSSGTSSISASIPSNLLLKKFRVYISCGGITTEVPGGDFTMNKMLLDPLSRLKYLPGSAIYFNGSGFNTNYALNNLYIGSYRINSTSAYSQLNFTLPVNIAPGDYSFFVFNGLDSVSTGQKVSIVQPKMTSISIDSAYVNSNITIFGENLMLYPSQSTYLYFGSQYVYLSSMDATKMVVTVPSIQPGNYTLHATIDNVQLQSTLPFTILRPKLTSLSPASGTAGSSIVINGQGFSTSDYISVYFGSTSVTVYPSSSTKMTVTVPSGLGKGTWQINAYQGGTLFTSLLSFTVN